MSPRVVAAANAHGPATIRSGTTRCRAGCSASTPWITSVEPPTPSIWAPISISIREMSTISGSRAALSITVVPVASTAAIRMFSVAPTDGKSSPTAAPRRPCGASATR